jgi:hypothetical protein
MNDKKKAQLILAVIGGRDTFEDSLIWCRINFRTHKFSFMHVKLEVVVTWIINRKQLFPEAL